MYICFRVRWGVTYTRRHSKTLFVLPRLNEWRPALNEVWYGVCHVESSSEKATKGMIAAGEYTIPKKVMNKVASSKKKCCSVLGGEQTSFGALSRHEITSKLGSNCVDCFPKRPNNG